MNSFRLIETGWDAIFDVAAGTCKSEIRIITPFLQLDPIKRLLVARPSRIYVITRLNLDELFSGVNGIDALQWLLSKNAEIRGVQHLHAKAYIFDAHEAIVTSANLTTAALIRNHELGFSVTSPDLVSECTRYFDRLWSRSGNSLTQSALQKISTRLSNARRSRVSIVRDSLGDMGINLGNLPSAALLSSGFPLGTEAFVKFSGIGSDRLDSGTYVLDEIKRSGMHWACSYPAAKAPRGPQDDDTMFLARLTSKPNDVIIYGRAIARAFDPKRDRASVTDIRRRPFMKNWPLFIRVQGAEFVAGTLDNGVRLSELVDTFNEFSFASTERRALAGEKKIKPRASLKQKAAIRLSQRSKVWLNSQLEIAFARHGIVPKATVARLP